MACFSKLYSHKKLTPTMEMYEVGKSLGNGACGITPSCKNRVSNKKYACKVVKKFSQLRKERERMQNESNILYSIKYIKRSKIISVHDVIENESSWYIIMELCRGGTLSDYLHKFGTFIEFKAARIIKEIMEAIVACHKRGIVHRDLSLNNVMY